MFDRAIYGDERIRTRTELADRTLAKTIEGLGKIDDPYRRSLLAAFIAIGVDLTDIADSLSRIADCAECEVERGR